MGFRILVRDLDEQTVQRLKQRARAHGRSLQAELKEILSRAARTSPEQTLASARAWQQRLEGRPFADSTELLHEDRAR